MPRVALTHSCSPEIVAEVQAMLDAEDLPERVKWPSDTEFRVGLMRTCNPFTKQPETWYEVWFPKYGAGLYWASCPEDLTDVLDGYDVRYSQRVRRDGGVILWITRSNGGYPRFEGRLLGKLSRPVVLVEDGSEEMVFAPSAELDALPDVE